jgi:hypothetical protein
MAITTEQRTKAFEMFDQGTSTNEVAKQLFKNYWTKAKKVRDEWQTARDGGNSGTGEAEAAEAEPDAWDLELQVPTARMDVIILGFTPQEKADAIRNALQNRLNPEES